MGPEVSERGLGDGERAGWISFGRRPRGGGEGAIAMRSRDDEGEEEEEVEEKEVDHVIVLSRKDVHSGICGMDENIPPMSPGSAMLGDGDNVDNGRLALAPVVPVAEFEGDGRA